MRHNFQLRAEKEIRDLGAVKEKLEADYPGRRIFAISAQSGEGMEEWLESIEARSCAPAAVMEVDYQRYGKGEARLGWLNATVRVGTGKQSVDGAAALHGLVHAITDRLERAAVEIAHFKMTLQDASGTTMRAQVTRNGEKPLLAGALEGAVRNGTLLINLRAEAEPEELAEVVTAGLAATLEGVAHEVVEMKYFKPGQPVPTHRVVDLVA